MNIVEVPHIEKPVHSTYVYVYDKYIKEAIRTGSMMKVSCPGASALVDPREWARTGKVMYKVFRDPKHPMRLFGNYIPVPQVSTDKPGVEQLSLI